MVLDDKESNCQRVCLSLTQRRQEHQKAHMVGIGENG